MADGDTPSNTPQGGPDYKQWETLREYLSSLGRLLSGQGIVDGAESVSIDGGSQSLPGSTGTASTIVPEQVKHTIPGQSPPPDAALSGPGSASLVQAINDLVSVIRSATGSGQQQQLVPPQQSRAIPVTAEGPVTDSDVSSFPAPFQRDGGPSDWVDAIQWHVQREQPVAQLSRGTTPESMQQATAGTDIGSDMVSTLVVFQDEMKRFQNNLINITGAIVADLRTTNSRLEEIERYFKQMREAL